MTVKNKDLDMSKFSELAETILEGIDYDIFKEDLEERELLDWIEYKLRESSGEWDTPAKIEVGSTSVSFKSESGDCYMFTSPATTIAGVLSDLACEWYLGDKVYIEAFDTDVGGINEYIIQSEADKLGE